MKILQVLTIFYLIFLLACNEKSSIEYSKIKEDIIQLESFEEKKIYLENILKDDQEVRNPEKSSEIITQFGRDSKEYHEYGKAIRQQDQINLFKVEQYLSFHKYPEKKMGEKATMAPWMVIHHSPGYEVRERNFKTIYNAYLKGIIDIEALSFFLGRMYEIKFGERHRMENPYKMEDEVDLLIEKMELKTG